MRLLFSLSVSFLFFSCQSQPVDKSQYNKDSNTLLWEISGNNLTAPSYLYGTFHLMCKEDIIISENLKKSISKSKFLYLEMDMDDPANTFGALLYLNMKGGKTLKDLYTAAEYSRVETFFKDSLKMGLAMLQKTKPNFLEAMFYPLMMPCKQMDGVEEELMSLAKKENKEIKGLETMAFQASVFDSIPYDEQAKDLLKMMDSFSVFKKEFTNMLNIYKSQKLNEIEKSFADEPGFEKNKDLLLDNRNKNWVIQLKSIMQKDNVFIAVGAGHLVGENGLISLLRKEGYILKPIKNTGK